MVSFEGHVPLPELYASMILPWTGLLLLWLHGVYDNRKVGCELDALPITTPRLPRFLGSFRPSRRSVCRARRGAHAASQDPGPCVTGRAHTAAER